MALTDIRALAFDLFGTVVDWREGVAREAVRLLGEGVDGHALASRWRAGYQPALEAVRSGARGWVDIDVLNREVLVEILPEFGLTGLPGATLDELNLAWRRLDPWPDAVEGLTRLRERFIIAPVSNAHIALVVDMSRRGGLVWDAILGAQVSGGYKPQAQVYDDAARLLGLAPHQVLMVASHPGDLAGAAGRGLRTAYVHRPTEYGRELPRPAPGTFDIHIDGFVELAQRLGA